MTTRPPATGPPSAPGRSAIDTDTPDPDTFLCGWLVADRGAVRGAGGPVRRVRAGGRGRAAGASNIITGAACDRQDQARRGSWSQRASQAGAQLLAGDSAPLAGAALAYGPFVAALGERAPWLLDDDGPGDMLTARHRLFARVLGLLGDLGGRQPVRRCA